MENDTKEFLKETKMTIKKAYCSTQDIFDYNFKCLEQKQIEQEDLLVQKELMEQELRKYIGSKFKEIYRPLKKESLEKSSIVSLVNALSTLKPEEKKDIINSFTNYIIRFMFKFQRIEVTWKLVGVKESTLFSINDYEFDLLTPKNYNPLEVLNVMWNFFESFYLKENRKRA